MAPLPKIPFLLSRHFVTETEILPLLIHSMTIKYILLVQVQINMGLLFLTFTSNNIPSLISRRNISNRYNGRKFEISKHS